MASYDRKEKSRIQFSGTALIITKKAAVPLVRATAHYYSSILFPERRRHLTSKKYTTSTIAAYNLTYYFHIQKRLRCQQNFP